MRRVCSPFSTCLTLLIACAPITALAQFSDASLDGRFASRYEVAGAETAAGKFHPLAVEVLVFDGAGGVTGTRTFTTWRISGNNIPIALTVVRQTLAGRYSVDAEGLGSLTLAATPVLEFRTQNGSPPIQQPDDIFQMSPDETRQLVVQQGGGGVAFTGNATYVYALYNQAYGIITWSADAVSQASPCAAPRLNAGSPLIPRLQR